MSETVVERLWALFEARDWDRAAAELADDFVAEWPRTGERFHGPDVFIAMNRAHPAPNWHVAVKRVVAEGDQVAAEVEVTHDDGVDFCLGFYEIRKDGSRRRPSTGSSERSRRHRSGGPSGPRAWSAKVGAVDAASMPKEELARLLREAEQAHAEYEQVLGHRDEDWPSWYAGWILEQLERRRQGPDA